MSISFERNSKDWTAGMGIIVDKRGDDMWVYVGFIIVIKLHLTMKG